MIASIASFQPSAYESFGACVVYSDSGCLRYFKAVILLASHILVP